MKYRKKLPFVVVNFYVSSTVNLKYTSFREWEIYIYNDHVSMRKNGEWGINNSVYVSPELHDLIGLNVSYTYTTVLEFTFSSLSLFLSSDTLPENSAKIRTF